MKYICIECKKELKYEEVYECHREDTYCKECFDSKFLYCKLCDSLIHPEFDDYGELDGGSVICEECIEK